MEKWGQNIKKEQCHGNVTNLVRILANFTFHLGEPTYLNSTMKTLEKGVYNIDTRTKFNDFVLVFIVTFEHISCFF